jgi:hypothetical protein
MVSLVFMGPGFWFFWDIGFSRYWLDSLYYSTETSNVTWLGPPNKRTNAQFAAFSFYIAPRKNTIAATRTNTLLFVMPSYYRLI